MRPLDWRCSSQHVHKCLVRSCLGIGSDIDCAVPFSHQLAFLAMGACWLQVNASARAPSSSEPCHSVFPNFNFHALVRPEEVVPSTNPTCGLELLAFTETVKLKGLCCRGLWNGIRAVQSWKCRPGHVSTATCSSWMACGRRCWSISPLWTSLHTPATWATPRSLTLPALRR